MSYNHSIRFSGAAGSAQTPSSPPMVEGDGEWRNRPLPKGPGQRHEPFAFHGAALARDPWAEQYGPWIVLGFSATFAIFLILMALAGQAPGKSFLLKSVSDILQFVGEGIGFVFCARIASRLHKTTRRLRAELMQKEGGHYGANVVAAARAEVQATQRAFLAWTLLAVAVALYAGGQAVWTSYDVRMNSADVPFPGIYDIGFVVSYPFFLLGTLLLTRRNKAAVGQARLILDALAVIGAALAFSWFFLLGPSIAGLAQSPSPGAAFLSLYFPTGDLFLVAVGAFLMFSPLSHREQQPVFFRLCLGLFFLAITDSLLGYYNLAGGFNTGTLQDVLWPLSMALIGLAAIEYPHSMAREQEQLAHSHNAAASPLLAPSRYSQITTTLQTITPFILALITCAMLLTVIAPRGGSVLVQADLVALALILIVVARQALTLIENNRLTMQMRGELVISRRELQVTRREADEATRTAQEKRVLEEGIAILRDIHARVARGDLAARAPTVPGPLLPIAISLNLMLDRLSALSQRGAKYDVLVRESRMLQVAVERLGQGLPAWAPNQPAPQSQTELRALFLGLVHLQRFQEGQWRRLTGTMESMSNLIRRLREALSEMRRSNLFGELGQANFERMILDRAIREAELLDQQQRMLLNQAALLAHPGVPQESAVPSAQQHEQGQPSQAQSTPHPEPRPAQGGHDRSERAGRSSSLVPGSLISSDNLYQSIRRDRSTEDLR